MLDKFVYVNRNCVVLVFTNRGPVVIRTDNGTAAKLATYMFEYKITVDFPTYINCSQTSQEDTCLILAQTLKEVA